MISLSHIFGGRTSPGGPAPGPDSPPAASQAPEGSTGTAQPATEALSPTEPPRPTPVIPSIRAWVPARCGPDPTIPERPPEFGWMADLDVWTQAVKDGKQAAKEAS